MRVLSKVALGGSALSAAVAGGLVAAGLFTTGATLVVADPVPPPAQADGLTAYRSCAQLLATYVQHGVADVGPYGWTGPLENADSLDLPMRSGQLSSMKSVVGASAEDRAALPAAAAAGSATGTNTQESDVDEPDVAKTDGSLVVRIVADRKLVLVDVAHGVPTVTHRLWLPTDGGDSELLLVGHHVLITQTPYGRGSVGPGPVVLDGDRRPYGGGPDGTRILDVDISDPHAPVLLSTETYSGELLALRQYGDTVRVVTATPRPELNWVLPRRGLSEAEATRRNRALVRATTIEDWLPSVTRDGTRRTLVGCGDVSHPQQWSGGSTVALTTFGIDDAARSTSVALTADGDVVYSSATRLYVASTVDRHEPGERVALPLAEPCSDCVRTPEGSAPQPVDPPVTTDLHAFALDGTSTTYRGSGHVLGTLRDRWSLDEHDGTLRVAWSRLTPRGTTTNAITVLAEQGDRLEPLGTVGGLGTDEDIESVRWFDDLALVVTFRHVDPLHTVDLSDPAHPRTLGVLRLPGYSGYLHPLGGGLVLGLGVAADRRGSEQGSQAAVFDITDPARPRQVARVDLGRETGLGALDDPRGFTWVPDERTGVTAVTDWVTGRARLVALRVGAAGSMRSDVLTQLNHDGQARTLALPGGRLAVLDSHRVRVVDLG
jgi:hypothetical protein